MKNMQLLLLFFADNSCLLSHCMLAWNKFSLRRRTFHCTFNFKNLCTTKKRSFRFVFRHKHRRASTGGFQGIQTPALFLYSPNYVLKLFNRFRRNALENQFKQRKNSAKRCINSILLKFFNATLRRVLMNVK